MSLAKMSTLSQRLQAADPTDAGVHAESLQTLCDVAEVIRSCYPPEVTFCLLAAAHLLEALSGPVEEVNRAEVHRLACDLVSTVEAAVASRDEALAQEARSEADASQGEPGAEVPASTDEIRLATDPAGTAPKPPAGPQAEPQAKPEPQPAAPPSPAAGNAIRIDAERPASEAAPSTEPKTDQAAAKGSEDPPLGRILLASKQITRAQLANALRFHRTRKMPIGECLLLLGACSPEALLSALRHQEQTREAGKAPEKPAKKVPKPAPSYTDATQANMEVTTDMFLGEVLLGADMITHEQLEKAMHVHHLDGVRVGDALLSIGALTREELEAGLVLQRHLRNAAVKRARPPKPDDAGPQPS